jgi:hypothetical protein
MLDRLFGSPTRDSFARLVISGLRRAGEARKIHFDRELFCLRPDGDDVAVMNLSNLYGEFCAAAKATRPKLLKTIVRNWFADRRPVPEAFEDVHPDLLPAVRSRAYFEFAALQVNLDEEYKSPDCPQQVLADHLSIGLVYDLPDSMRAVVRQDLENWDVTFYEALEAACANLRQKEDPVFISPHEGVYLSATGDNYDASRMILTDMLHQFDVKGDLVAMVPNRDTFIVTGSRNLPGLKIMVARARQAATEPRPISTFAFQLADDEWREWAPPDDHPLHHDFAILRLQSLGQQYGEQKELLDARYHKNEQDVFVATFSGAENAQTGHVTSYCVWSDGIDSLLPKTDRVYFFRPDSQQGKIIAVSDWDAVSRIAGPLMELQDMYPARYRVRSFPSEAQLRQLASAP